MHGTADEVLFGTHIMVKHSTIFCTTTQNEEWWFNIQSINSGLYALYSVHTLSIDAAAMKEKTHAGYVPSCFLVFSSCSHPTRRPHCCWFQRQGSHLPCPKQVRRCSCQCLGAHRAAGQSHSLRSRGRLCYPRQWPTHWTCSSPASLDLHTKTRTNNIRYCIHTSRPLQ